MKQHPLKKTAQLFATLTLCVGALVLPARAAELKAEPSAETIHAGENVTVTLKLGGEVKDCTTLACTLHFDGSLFTLRSGKSGDNEPRMNHTAVVSGNGNDCSTVISFVDETAQGTTLPDGALYTLTFAASALCPDERSADFTIEAGKTADTDFSLIPMSAGKQVRVTVLPLGETGYTIFLPLQSAVQVGETVAVPVTFSCGEESTLTSYSAASVTLSYDTSRLRFLGCADASYTAEADGGTLRLVRYGSSCPLGAVVLKFETLAPGSAEVSLVSAYADDGEYADLRDAPPVKVRNGKYTVSITKTLPVTLPNNAFAGSSTAEYGRDYTFRVDTLHYAVGTITVTVDGRPVEFTDNGDGTYTIPGASVTGAIVVRADTALRTFAVGVSGNAKDDVSADTTARPGEDFTFTLNKKSGYNYSVSVKVADKSVTPVVSGSSYTIPGAGVTGDIAITATKTKNSSGGGGGGSSSGGSTAKNKAEIRVSEYVKLKDARSLWLITAKGNPGNGYCYAYGGSPMFRIDGGWLWLVMTNREAAEVESAARSAVTAKKGNDAGAIFRRGDVNGSNTRDLSDAILIHDYYNARLTDLDAVTMKKLLEADMNGDDVLDMRDSAALMALIK